MNNDIWYDHFLNALYEKYPKKSQLTEALMDLLCIEREAVYRRLRKSVAFSIYDIAKIVNAWNISIDTILKIVSDENHLFQMSMLPYNNLLKKDLETMENWLLFLESVASSPASEYMEVSNILPESILGDYPVISKFYLFKWLYHYGNGTQVPSFSQFALPERLLTFGKQCSSEIKRIKHVSYIWDSLLIRHLINDIRYFESIYLLSGDDIQQLKQEICIFLKDLEDISIHGEFAETHNRVDLYISQISIDTNHCCYYSPSVKLCGIRTFIKYTAASTSEPVCENFRKWVLAQKKVSVLISQVDEKQRIEFFRQQQELLGRL
jgi:hypothetical protein